MVKTGLSAVIGSWKIIDDRGPELVQPALVERQHIPAANLDRTGNPAACGSRRISARMVTLLPEPDSPRSKHLAAGEVDIDPVDGVTPCGHG